MESKTFKETATSKKKNQEKFSIVAF